MKSPQVHKIVTSLTAFPHPSLDII